MPLIDHIDGENRNIYLHIDTVGVDFEPMEAYKEMRTLRRTDENLRKYDLFLQAKGKDPKGGGKFTERYVVQLKGTKFIPYDTTQELTVIGTVITDDGQEGVSCFDRTPLSPSTLVDINYVPKQVEIIELGSTPQEIAGAVWNQVGSAYDVEGTFGHILNQTRYLKKGVYVNPELLVNGDGSSETPFNNIGDAIDYAEAHSLREIIALTEITLDRNLKNFIINGIGTPVVNCGGFNLKGTEFYHCRMRGSYTNSIIVQQSVLDNGFYLNGFFENCGLLGTLTCIDGGIVLIKDSASIGDVTISMNGVGFSNLTISNQTGDILIMDCNNALDNLVLGMKHGKLTIDNTCTDGDISLRGDCLYVNNSILSPDISALNNKIEVANAVWNKTLP